MVSRAAGADEHEGYEDVQGNWRVPHKLMMVQVHAGWCRVCKGLQPKLLKLITKHPEVLCCKINKTHHEVSASHPNRLASGIWEKVVSSSTSLHMGGFRTHGRRCRIPYSRCRVYVPWGENASLKCYQYFVGPNFKCIGRPAPGAWHFVYVLLAPMLPPFLFAHDLMSCHAMPRHVIVAGACRKTWGAWAAHDYFLQKWEASGPPHNCQHQHNRGGHQR